MRDLTLNQRVTGSSPVQPTNNFNSLEVIPNCSCLNSNQLATNIASKAVANHQTHNLKVVGSNPTPATNDINGLDHNQAKPFLRLEA